MNIERLQLGETVVEAEVYGEGASLMLHLHGDEGDAYHVGLAKYASLGVRFVHLRSTQRLLSFTLHGRTYTVDPNRVFTRAGAVGSVLPQEWDAGVAAYAFGEALLSRFQVLAAPHVVALHNNYNDPEQCAPDPFNFCSVVCTASDSHREPGEDLDDFVLVTTRTAYDFAVAHLGANVALQNSRRVCDDGSLSVRLGKADRDYINLECRRKVRDRQERMLDALRPYLVDPISPTALLLASLRARTALPLAREIAEATDALEAATRLFGDPRQHLYNVPFAEARFRCLDANLRRLGLKQVLELGAGFGFRGRVWAEDPAVVFVDTDLPSVQRTKAELLQRVPALRSTGRLTYATADARVPESIEAAGAAFTPGNPVGVVHEGLLGYFDFEDKARTAEGVRRLLERAGGGAWITTDLGTHEDLDRFQRAFPGWQQGQRAVEDATQRRFRDLAFTNDFHAARFFGDLGFDLEIRPQLDGSFDLTTPAAFGVTPEMLAAAAPRVWVLRRR